MPLILEIYQFGGLFLLKIDDLHQKNKFFLFRNVFSRIKAGLSLENIKLVLEKCTIFIKECTNLKRKCTIFIKECMNLKRKCTIFTTIARLYKEMPTLLFLLHQFYYFSLSSHYIRC
ncbi:hypothetical protein G8761_09560 [Bacillus sp. C11]|nr:hypothetical protein [Neobacillus terrae]